MNLSIRIQWELYYRIFIFVFEFFSLPTKLPSLLNSNPILTLFLVIFTLSVHEVILTMFIKLFSSWYQLISRRIALPIAMIIFYFFKSEGFYVHCTYWNESLLEYSTTKVIFSWFYVCKILCTLKMIRQKLSTFLVLKKWTFLYIVY